MPDNYLAGKYGYVSASNASGTVTYSFDKWTLDINCDLPKVTNFTSGGFQNMVANIFSAKIGASGPYNAGNTPIAAGSAYLFTLGFSQSIFIQVTGLVSNISPSVDINGAAHVAISADSIGSFTVGIV